MIDPTQTSYSSPIRDFEVWVTQILGVSLPSKQHNFTKNDKSRQTEI